MLRIPPCSPEMESTASGIFRSFTSSPWRLAYGIIHTCIYLALIQVRHRLPNHGNKSEPTFSLIQRDLVATGSFLTGGGMPEKYQDEIEEIMRRAGEAAPTEPSKEVELLKAVQRGASPVRSTQEQLPPTEPSVQRRMPRLSPGKLLLAGFVVFLLGAFAWPPGIWIGLGMVVVAYLLFFVTPRSMSTEKWWRGKRMDEAQSPWDRVKNWLKSG